jgi:hypothetical protein
MSVLEKLTEGIVRRDVSKEGQALLAKWEQTGLLEGITNENQRNGMAVLLENQAKELLREASSMSAGDVEGFASVAFPIVRRVFGGLIANDLVSVQPMSLPSGLIFFLDFVHSDSIAGLAAGESIYGGNVVGRNLINGVDLDDDLTQGGPGGFYDLGTGYSHATGSVVPTGTDADHATNGGLVIQTIEVASKLVSALTEAEKKLMKFDPDVLANSSDAIAIVTTDFAKMSNLNEDALQAIDLGVGTAIVSIDDGTAATTLVANTRCIRRLTQKVDATTLRFVLVNTAGTAITHVNGTAALAAGDALGAVSFPVNDSFSAAGSPSGLGAVVASDFPLEGAADGNANRSSLGKDSRIPEIDIKVDSIAVTAQTKKLKAKWTPELGQDLNAYHNLDAEVELTGILSEQIALEIDQEILSDLIQGAKAGTRYWSRAPGLFVDSSGSELGASSAAPDFTGTVSEWYETLIETINDVSAQIHRKTLRGGANFVVCSPEVANILEFTSGFRASVTADADRGDIGAVKAGSLSKKFDVMVDPYFPRNVLLVGRRGNSFLESGYVYAPYVPLQVTPTIFGTEDFVPRKGVMTRYAKKMVRPDMYGLVIVRGLLGEQGAS